MAGRPALVRRAARDVGRLGVRPHPMGHRRSGGAGTDGAHHPDREHELSRDVPSRQCVLPRVRAVLGGAQPREGGPGPLARTARAGLCRVPTHRSRRSRRRRHPFFNDWLRHAEADEYWQRIDGRNRARTIKAPVLLMAAGTTRFCRPSCGTSRPCSAKPRRKSRRAAVSSSAPGLMPTGCGFPTARRGATTGPRAWRRAFPGSIITCSAERRTSRSPRPFASM